MTLIQQDPRASKQNDYGTLTPLENRARLHGSRAEKGNEAIFVQVRVSRTLPPIRRMYACNGMLVVLPGNYPDAAQVQDSHSPAFIQDADAIILICY